MLFERGPECLNCGFLLSKSVSALFAPQKMILQQFDRSMFRGQAF
jgi:hypothetical protein